MRLESLARGYELGIRESLFTEHLPATLKSRAIGFESAFPTRMKPVTNWNFKNIAVWNCRALTHSWNCTGRCDEWHVDLRKLQVNEDIGDRGFPG